MKNQVGNISLGSTDLKVAMLSQRVEVLEEKIFRKVNRVRATEAQRFLLYYYDGGIDKVLQDSTTFQKNKNLFLSVMLDIDPDNAGKFLSQITRKAKPLLDTESNYSFLVDFYKMTNNFARLIPLL